MSATKRHLESRICKAYFTFDDLEKLPIEQFEHLTENGPIQYMLSPWEARWLLWFGDRFAITTYLLSTFSETDTCTIDPFKVSEALKSDGVDRAQCLSDASQLARLIWFMHSRN